MKIGIVIFPGSNCDNDLFRAFKKQNIYKVIYLWHKDPELPKDLDVCAIPGGFSFGDYLRTGAIASKSPIISAIIKFAKSGGFILGICNGFQILCETGLLPGILLRNNSTKFVCKNQILQVCNSNTSFSKLYNEKEEVIFPIAHHDGNYFVDNETKKMINENNQVAFKYLNNNPNGSIDNIAGVYSQNHRILGLMPHPERRVSSYIGLDGERLFRSLNS
ncbi:MAG: phosphoribosylformylglycinamidine synthase subunit PurQ [Paracoccaceae bacterium]|tara:strand:- start:54 stop:710 length:657 start_codon:yes stop_codon:yes gene_type:complete